MLYYNVNLSYLFNDERVKTRDFKDIPDPEAIKIYNQHLRKFYGENERPVFFGHYWLTGVPKLIRDKKKLESMSEAAWKYGIRDAAEKMAREIIALAESYRLRK